VKGVAAVISIVPGWMLLKVD